VTRLRVALALVALALLVPLALLVGRALESEAEQRAARERAVAERVFDEMERALSDFLAREEARPVGQYRFFMTPEGAGADVHVRSPLASAPEAPFVLGYFQLDPDGSLHSPLLPRPDESARAAAEPTLPASLRADAERVLALVRAANGPRAERDERDALRAKDAKAQDEEGADPAPRKELSRNVPRAPEAVKEGKGEGVYDALQKLNRGAELRAQRARKLAPADEQLIAQAAPPPAPSAARAPAPAPGPPPAPGPAPARLDAVPSVAEAIRERAAAEPQARESAEAPAAAKRAASAAAVVPERQAPPPSVAPERAASEGAIAGGPEVGRAAIAGGRSAAPAASLPPTPSRVAVDPMIGRALGDGLLLLQRTVLVGDRGLRQGLVVDVAKLGERLRAVSLGDGRLPGADAQIGLEPDARGGADVAAAHLHRFAEPFDALGVGLVLPPLGGASGVSTILVLAGLVLAATLVGLVAVERMVAVAVGFAERRSNFVAAVSHELKTPLTSIRLYGEMLRDGMVASDEKRAEYYRTITAEAERLSRLIGNVLELSRLEKGTREMALAAGPIGPVVQELAAFLRPHAESEGFALEIDVAPDLPSVRFERDALLQLLFNLVDNAVKYARGAAERRIVVSCRAAQGGGVELAVRDFGPGVPGPQLRRVFEPFHRAQSELTRTAPGTGLGLALVRGLAERMDARVAGANAPGGGFEVRLRFPATPR
jgi:signal transduction histidine kinase